MLALLVSIFSVDSFLFFLINEYSFEQIEQNIHAMGWKILKPECLHVERLK